MTETISVPLWFVLVFGLLAVWAVLDLLLMPSVRWVLRRGTNRIIDELNVRLRIAAIAHPGRARRSRLCAPSGSG
jgi:hypothetical protein